MLSFSHSVFVVPDSGGACLTLTRSSGFAPAVVSRSRLRPLPFLRMASSAPATRPATAPHSVRNANVVIVGGGPCGSLAAILLRERGIPVTLIEKVPDFTDFDANRSYVLGLSFRGRRILEKVPGLYEHVARESMPVAGTNFTTLLPDGQINVFSFKFRNVPRPDGGRFIRLLRPGLLEGLKSFVLENCGDTVNAIYGTAVKAISFEEDGEMELLLDTGGREHALRSRLILACDGRNSIVVKEMTRAIEAGTSWTESTNGCGDTSYFCSSAGLKVQSIVLDDDVIEKFARPDPQSPTGKVFPKDVCFLRGQKGTRQRADPFNITIFPLLPKYKRASGGIVGTIITRPDHPLWDLGGAEEAYNLFEEAFPQVNVREYISSANMQKFVEARPIVLPPVSRRASLVHLVGRHASGGVVVLGDAAHSFPPDLGQGINSAFEDVGVLASAIDDASAGDEIGAILKRYETLREEDTSGLIGLCRVAAPNSFGQNAVAGFLLQINTILRLKLANLFPGVIYPSLNIMVVQDLPYGEMLRRANATTSRLYAGLFALFLVPCLGVLASRLFS